MIQVKINTPGRYTLQQNNGLAFNRNLQVDTSALEYSQWMKEIQSSGGELISDCGKICPNVDPVTRRPMSEFQQRCETYYGDVVTAASLVGASAILASLSQALVASGIMNFNLKDIVGMMLSTNQMDLTGTISIQNTEIHADDACKSMCVGNVHKKMDQTRKGLVFPELAEDSRVVDLDKRGSIYKTYPVTPATFPRYDTDRNDVNEGKSYSDGTYEWKSQGSLPKSGNFPYFQKIKDAGPSNDYHRQSNISLFMDLFSNLDNWIWLDFRMMGEGMESAMLQATTNGSKTALNWLTNPIGSIFGSEKGIVKDIKNAYDWDFIDTLMHKNMESFVNFINGLFDYGCYEDSDTGVVCPKSGFIAYSGKPAFTLSDVPYYYSDAYDYTISGDFRVKSEDTFSNVMRAFDAMTLSELAYCFGRKTVMHIGVVDGYLIRYSVSSRSTHQSETYKSYASELSQAKVLPGLFDFLYMTRLRHQGWPIRCFTSVPVVFTT